MSFSYISRCGDCSERSKNDNSDICDLPTPSKYNSCYQKNYSSYNLGCEPGYDIKCDYQIEGSRTLLCCPKLDTKENLLSVECNDNSCSIKIAYLNKKLECSSKASFLACLNDPDTTYVGGIKDEFPIPWLIYPKEIYDSLKTISSPCAGSDDYSCLPYSELYKANSISDINGLCPSGKLNNYAYFNENASCSVLESKGNCTRTKNTECLPGQTKKNECSNNETILCCDMPESQCYSLSKFIPTNNTEKDIYCQMVCPSYEDQLFIGVENPCDSTYYDICKQSNCKIDPICEIGWTKQQIKNGQLMPNRLPNVNSI